MAIRKLPILAKIAKEAGDVIAAMQDDIVARKDWEIKEDGSIVTPADLEANRIVCERLKEHFPGVAIVSEENSKESNAKALKARDRFDTDPLDNTSGYAKGKDGFSVNIGRIIDGVPVDGVIYFPAKKELYFTGDDGKAYLQKGDNAPKEINVRPFFPPRSTLNVAVGFNEKNTEHLQDVPFETESHPAQYRTCMVATGQCDITGVNHGAGGGFNSYDIAGPHAVLRAAGGDFFTRDGKPLRYTDDIKVPDHYACGVDTAIVLKLTDKQAVGTDRVRQ